MAFGGRTGGSAYCSGRFGACLFIHAHPLPPYEQRRTLVRRSHGWCSAPQQGQCGQEAHQEVCAASDRPVYADQKLELEEAQGYRWTRPQALQGMPAYAQRRIRIRQAHPEHPPQRVLQVPRPQREGARAAPHAQQEVRGGDRPQRLLAQAQGDCGARRTAPHPRHQRRRQAQRRGGRLSLPL